MCWWCSARRRISGFTLCRWSYNKFTTNIIAWADPYWDIRKTYTLNWGQYNWTCRKDDWYWYVIKGCNKIPILALTDHIRWRIMCISHGTQETIGTQKIQSAYLIFFCYQFSGNKTKCNKTTWLPSHISVADNFLYQSGCNLIRMNMLGNMISWYLCLLFSRTRKQLTLLMLQNTKTVKTCPQYNTR